jgi:homoserine kinase type II
MAVYTHLDDRTLAALLGEFDVGTLVSAKGIAEGVSNSNWMVDTSGRNGGGGRFILTMYERRIELDDLPFFLGLLDHLAARHCPVPRTIHDRQGQSFRMLGDKALALIEFLPGVSIDRPEPEQALAVGKALAGIHLASADFAMSRENTLGFAAWQPLAESCGAEGLASIDPELPELVRDELAYLGTHWPQGLPRSVIHADLFPDNVLMMGDKVSGLIDFYFACNDVTAYDLAVTHAAWCFNKDGRGFRPEIGKALVEGYESVRPLSASERDCLPVLARGASLRFAMTRAEDWLHTPADALVTRKDPMAFVRRLRFYADEGAAAFGN